MVPGSEGWAKLKVRLSGGTNARRAATFRVRSPTAARWGVRLFRFKALETNSLYLGPNRRHSGWGTTKSGMPSCAEAAEARIKKQEMNPRHICPVPLHQFLW